jgi:hypothetical protein
MSWTGQGENGHGGWASDDPELDAIFPDEPELRETARLLARVPRADPPLNPAFKAALRRRLMQEAWEQSAPAVPWWRRLVAPRAMAWAGATVGVLLIAVVVYTLTVSPTPPSSQVIVSSPLQGSHAVAATKPIELTFSQAMNTSSVEDSIQIQPATKVKTYQWTGASTVDIVPENGLAPNTQYHVIVGPKAKTQSGHPVVNQPGVTFVTAPPATPRPITTPAPTPRPTPDGITAPRLIASSGAPSPAWSPDGSILYVVGPGGQLQGFSVASGAAPSTRAPGGVTFVTVGGDATVAYVRGSQVVDGEVSIPGIQSLALGFQSGRLLGITGQQVQVLAGSGQGTAIASLAENATAADFSPDGRRLAYLGASGLHLVDLSTGHDAAVGDASGLGAWSKDGRYAYPASDGVYVTDGSSAGSKLLSVPGAASVSWSTSSQLLVTTPSELLISNADGTGLRTLAQGAFVHATWSPAGDASFWFKRQGGVWVASVNPTAGGATSSSELVNQFMMARQQGNATLANRLLDAHGKQAFSSLTLTYGSRVLSRYYTLLSQPGQVVERIILDSGQTVLDETLTIARDSSGNLLIDDATDSPVTLTSGPNILNVTVTSTQVRVTFDSDLDPSTVSGVVIAGVPTNATYRSGTRTVILTPEGGLTPGTTYLLTLNGTLKDVNHTPAAGYQLTFTGPGA